MKLIYVYQNGELVEAWLNPDHIVGVLTTGEDELTITLTIQSNVETNRQEWLDFLDRTAR